MSRKITIRPRALRSRLLPERLVLFLLPERRLLRLVMLVIRWRQEGY
jgi:hypothetical protein